MLPTSLTAIGWSSSGGTTATSPFRTRPTIIAGKSWNCTHDREWDRTSQHELFLCALAGVVRVAFHSIDADDRKQHVMPYLRARFRIEQMAGCRFEHRPGRGGVVRPEVRHVDQCVHTSKGTVESGTGFEIDASRSCQDNRNVPRSLQRPDRVSSDGACAAGDSHSHS
jgi:hypothetical protein